MQTIGSTIIIEKHKQFQNDQEMSTIFQNVTKLLIGQVSITLIREISSLMLCVTSFIENYVLKYTLYVKNGPGNCHSY